MMKKNHITELIPEYLDGLLSESKKEEVRLHLKECELCLKELEEYKTIFNAFEEEKEVIPSERIRTNFFEQIEIEKQKKSKVVPLITSTSKKEKTFSYLLKVAASILLLVGGYSLGNYQQEQKGNYKIAQLQEKTQKIKQTAMLSLIGNKSASKRIQGVNYIDEFSNPDEAIVAALVDRMLYDENTNVRLTAVEALSNFITSEEVKNAFIKALKIEKAPAIQIIIIQVLVKIQEKKAIIPMKKLLEQNETQPFIKEQIKSSIINIV